jgi:ribonuclease HI
VFKTALISAMEVEAALAPPRIRLDSSVQKYAFRLQKLFPRHPVNREPVSLAATDQEIEERGKAIPKNHIQLKLIRDSIRELVDFDSLEPIEHFKFPPWNRSAPYEVNVSRLSKEETKINHNQEDRQAATSIYTDASYIPSESQGIGVGLAVITAQNQTVHTQVSNIGLEGITQAIEYASSVARPGESFKVYSDNQASLYRLRTLSDDPGQDQLIRAIEAASQLGDIGSTISLEWVPGHVDIPGNELADSLAKKPGNQEKESGKVASNALNSSKASYYSKSFAWKARSKIQPPTGNEKEASQLLLPT